MASSASVARDIEGRSVAVRVARGQGMLGDGEVEAVLLKRSKKSLVVRLLQQGRDPLVAKRSSRRRAEAESRVYDEVLTRVPEGHVRLLGRFLDGDEGWLFLEDCGDLALDGKDPGMRAALGSLLGSIAVNFTTTPAPDFLPRYTSAYFHEVLETAERDLEYEFALAEDAHQRAVVGRGAHLLRQVDAVWSDVARVFDGHEVLCHADVVAKNVRFRAREGLPAPVLIDWELVGRGPRAVDLGCLQVNGPDDPLIVGYARVSGVPVSSLLDQASSGRLLRMVHAMRWAAMDLGTSVNHRGLWLIERYSVHIERVLAEMDEGRRRDRIG